MITFVTDILYGIPVTKRLAEVNIDKVTLDDLSVFKGEHSVFSLLNRCTTQAGAGVLRNYIMQPPVTYKVLVERQEAVVFWMQHLDKWTNSISNGTLVMIEKYFESADSLGYKPGTLGLFFDALSQRLFNRNQYSFIRFSVSHIIDFLKGCQELILLLEYNPPNAIIKELEIMQKAMEIPLCGELAATDPDTSQQKLLALSYHARREIKHTILNLLGSYARLDALHSLACATREHAWTIPELLPAEDLRFDAREMRHPLLRDPVSYNISFDRDRNFIFLTGANMSGKSTFIRTMGTAALLAHLGAGVPAHALKISFLEGIITNMQVEDNILLGESYFFAEVQRMKLTAQKLNRSRHHLVLMDELFKGTNVHDAYECSRAVIEGLLSQSNNLMVLSTHLYELSENLKDYSNVLFRYCYTKLDAGGSYQFTYQLREGVSNDKIGYLVLKNEGVLELLYKGTD